MPLAIITSFQSYDSSQALSLFNCFSDIDECATGTHNCSDYAVCNNTMGDHNCTCKKGFIGDGVNCTGNTFAFALVMLKTAVLLFLQDYFSTVFIGRIVSPFLFLTFCTYLVDIIYFAYEYAAAMLDGKLIISLIAVRETAYL